MVSSDKKLGMITLFLVAGLLSCAVADADVQEVRQLEVRLVDLAARKDSLLMQRSRVVEAAEFLAVRIDSMKAEDIPPESLQQALRFSLVLEQKLVDLDGRFEALMAAEVVHRDRLRLAYDWEIGALIQQLARAPDRGLLQQLVIYQEAREGLGDGLESGQMRFGDGMTISTDDSPDEISQKVDLMEDVAARMVREGQQNADRLSRLKEEHRLRSQVRVFATEIRLFDEHLPEGRVLVRVERSVGTIERGKSDGDFAGIDEAVDGPVEVGEVLVAQSELSRQQMTLGDVAAGNLALEIQKLKARQAEIRQLEAVARERAETFRAHLRELLEGSIPPGSGSVSE
jgi:hypothetical protein